MAGKVQNGPKPSHKSKSISYCKTQLKSSESKSQPGFFFVGDLAVQFNRFPGVERFLAYEQFPPPNYKPSHIHCSPHRRYPVLALQ